MIYIIAGLGNPGKDYENTRHNAGFMTVDIIAKKLGVEITKDKFNGLYGDINVDGNKIILLKPQTFMNLSGTCIVQFMNYFKVEDEDLIVIHDEIDFEAGQIKIRAKGSGGTHNGMKNICQMISSTNFPRIRVGVGNNKKYDLADYVLGHFSAEELTIMNPAFEVAADAALEIVKNGVDSAMNKFNTKKEKPKKEEV